jgi:hypothetical protein
MCQTWVKPAGYTCTPHACMSDATKTLQKCGADLCWQPGTPWTNKTGFCGPLTCQSYSECAKVAGERCDTNPQCHGFSLNEEKWPPNEKDKETFAKFFAKGAGGLVALPTWTAYTK